MKRSVLESIEGVEIYPIISLLIFITFFLIVIIYVVRMKSSEVDELSSLPLEDDNIENKNNYENNHA